MQKGVLVVSLILAASSIPQKSSGGCAEGPTGEWEEEKWRSLSAAAQSADAV